MQRPYDEIIAPIFFLKATVLIFVLTSNILNSKKKSSLSAIMITYGANLLSYHKFCYVMHTSVENK